MGDRYPTNMCIGGDISHDVALGLADQIVIVGFWPDGYEGDCQEALSVEELKQWTVPIHKYGKGPTDYLYLREQEMGYELGDFETWLKDKRVPFVRESEGYWEVGETTRWCIGDFDEELSTHENVPSVSMASIEEVNDLLNEGDIFGAQAKLSGLIYTIPLLPPFRIVDPAPKRTRRKKGP